MTNSYNQAKRSEEQAWEAIEEQRKDWEEMQAALNPYGAKLTERGEWRAGAAMDAHGFIEYRIDYGESDAGHHYLVDLGDHQGDQDSVWSKPFPTLAEAAIAAQGGTAWLDESKDHQHWEDRQIAELERNQTNGD